jgi:hypothetical protein
MPATTKEAQAERRTNIADWITAVFGIFWSVWWGFFINRVLDTKMEINIPFSFFSYRSTWDTESFKNLYLVFSVMITCAFSIAYVHWLWNAQKTAYKIFLVSSLVRFSAPLIFWMALFLTAVGMAAIFFSVPLSLILYGAILTFLWPVVVLITLWAG